MSTLPASLARIPRSALFWATAGVMAMVLFTLIPYQHWYFGERLSVLSGWWHLVWDDSKSEWIFCPFVPAICGVMVWKRLDEFKKLPFQGHWSGLVLLLVGMLMFWVGYKADTGYPAFAAVQLIAAGLVLWFCGTKWMRIALFPWLFLVFMWPAFPLEDQLAVPMRLMTANFSSKILSFMGIANIREGTGLLSAANAATGLAEGALFKLDVEDPCSGLRSLYALMMLSALYGYVFLRGWKTRLLLFLCALPLAMVGNLVRMVVLAVGSIWFGAEFAIGKQNEHGMEVSGFHEMAGFVVFAVALGGIFAISTLLEGVPWNKRKRVEPAQRPALNPQLESDSLLGSWKRVASVLGITASAIALCSFVSAQPPLSPPGVNMKLPSTVGSAPGQDIPMSLGERTLLASDVTISRKLYLTAAGKPMLAAVVLSGEGRRNLHRPDGCLPGQGWTILDKQVVPVTFNDGRTMDAMMFRVFRDVVNPETHQAVRQRGINLFWFQGYNGVQTPNYFGHVFYTYFDAIFENLNHRWALVSFFTQMPDSHPGIYDSLNEATAMEDLREFIGQIGPIMVKRPGDP